MKKQFYINFLIFLFVFTIFIPLIKLNNSPIYVTSENTSFFIKKGQISNESFSFSKSYELLESTKLNNSIECMDEIDIQIPEGNWNIKDIEMNFTNISMERELKIIEDNTLYDTNNLYYLNAANRRIGLALQIEIPNRTIIYGVYIYGSNASTIKHHDILFQIRGFNDVNHIPNGTIYGSTNLNISSTKEWYYQNFSSDPVELTKGSYTLVMNGTALDTIKMYYYWQRNPSDTSVNYHLYASEYVGNSWVDGITNNTYLCKLDQKIVNQSYFPINIDMTAKINGILQKIENGAILGTGTLKLSDINIPNITEILSIPISINKSIQLGFNLSYSINVNNKVFSDGTLIIKENMNNTWIIEPSFIKRGNNYTIRMDYPSNWNNLTVFKDKIVLSSGIFIDQHSIYLFDEVITEGADWIISANSLNRDLNLNIPKKQFLGGERLQFSVSPFEMNGNVSFLLINSLGFEEHKEEKEVTSSEILFTFNFPQKPYEGDWQVYVYWDTDTEAGIQSNLINVKIPFDPMIIVWSLTTAIISIVIGVSSYFTAKKYLTIQRIKTQKKINQYLDILKLNYIMLSERKSGLNFYEKSFTGKNIDPTLISGYLNAFKIFGVELAGSYQKSQIAKLEYQEIKIIMADYRSLRITLIFNGEPSKDFFELITSLSYEIEGKYLEELETFMGDRRKFIDVEKIIDKHLNTSFILPFDIYETESDEYNKSQDEIIKKIKNIKKINKLNFVFSSFLMKNQNFDLQTAEIITNLIIKGILRPIK